MKIKLNRKLWNGLPDQVMEVRDEYGQWAVNKGYATEIQTKVVTEYETKVIEAPKNKGGRPKIKK